MYIYILIYVYINIDTELCNTNKCSVNTHMPKLKLKY